MKSLALSKRAGSLIYGMGAVCAIDQTVEGFLNTALHLDSQQVSAQLKAEELGYL